MLRLLAFTLMLSLLGAVSDADAQAKKSAPAAARAPSASDPAISVVVYMRDAGKNELLLGTRIYPNNPEYNAVALQRYFALMKMLEPPYKQDDEVAYTWANKSKVTKCSIYLESPDAGVKTGTGATVGCEANGVSTLTVTSVADPKHPPSASQDPKHLSDVMDLFKKQHDRAKVAVGK